MINIGILTGNWIIIVKNIKSTLMSRIKMSYIKRRIHDLRNRDISWLFQIITLTITIVVLLTAIDYFTSKSSLEINRWEDSSGSRVWYCLDSIDKFYKDNSLDIPKELKKALSGDQRKFLKKQKIELEKIS